MRNPVHRARHDSSPYGSSQGGDGTDAPVSAAPDPFLLRACGTVGIAGCVALLLSNIVGSIVVPDYSWVSDTISNLAAGPYEIIQDVGFYGFAAALLACAIGGANAHPGSTRWSVGVIGLAAMAPLVIVIGARNEYGDQDDVTTWAVHLGMVYALMALFAATVLLMGRDLGRMRAGWQRWSLVAAGLFVVTGLAYFAAPTGIDGLVERIVGLIVIAWVGGLSRILFLAGSSAAARRAAAPR